MDSLNTIFENNNALFAQKALDYYYDAQLTHVVSLLDHTTAGRPGWKDKGLRPLYRNITKHVVSKSGLLYKDGMPEMEVHNDGGFDEQTSLKFNKLLDDEAFTEFMINFDVVLRLLKTGMILTQYDDYDSTIKFNILHRGNSMVETDMFGKRVIKLTMRTGSDGDYNLYRIFTETSITDLREKIEYGSKPEMIQEQDNPYGMVPVTPFYDTNLPRTRFWVEAPRDLITFNDIVNLNMVDLEYAASWSIHQTLYTNVFLVNGDGDQLSEDTVIGGPGKVVNIDTSQVDSPYLEYKGPQIDLDMSKELFATWMKDIAGDWAVTIKQDGIATQSVSGFSLIVQEKDNLELRQQRQRMQEMGLKRFYQTFIAVYNTHNVGAFNENTTLDVNFTAPKLPFDEAKNELMWSERLASGKASIIDYLMEKHNITRVEAEERAVQIKKDSSENLNET